MGMMEIKKAANDAKNVILELMGQKGSAADISKSESPNTIGKALSEAFVGTAQAAVYGMTAALNPAASKSVEKAMPELKSSLAGLVLPPASAKKAGEQVAVSPMRETRFVVDQSLQLPPKLSSKVA